MTFKFCSLASGSSGNCQYIETENSRILVDAGLSGVKIQNALISIGVDPNTINALLVTHEHIDHTKGIGVLSRRFDIPIYANAVTWKAMSNKIGKIAEYNIRKIDTNKDFTIEDINILPFATYHDAEEPVGYVFIKDKKKISILTDTGTICSRIKDIIKDSVLMLIESNHDVDMLVEGKYPWPLKKRILSDVGHLSNETCGNLICEIHEKYEATYLLGHLSNENNTPDVAYNTVINIVESKGYVIGDHLKVEMTYRDKPSKVYNI